MKKMVPWCTGEPGSFDLDNSLLCLDGITLRDFDFIDLGKILEPSGTVPVTIKSRVFRV
jgi:ethanolamine utilization protein EutA